jgi:ankyrin repeat protein
VFASLFKKASLLDLIRSGDVKALSKRINTANINLADEQGIMPLVHGILSRNVGVIELFLALGADIERAWQSRTTPVMVDVLETFNGDIVDLFLAKGYLIPAIIDGAPLLHAICIGMKCRNHGFIEWLLAHGVDINTLDDEGASVLARALGEPFTDAKLVELLLAHGVDVDRAGSSVWRPLTVLLENPSKSDNEKAHLINKLAGHIELPPEALQELLGMAVESKSSMLFLTLLAWCDSLNWRAIEGLDAFLTGLYFTPRQQSRLTTLNRERSLALPIGLDIELPSCDTMAALTPQLAFDLAIDLDIAIPQKRQLLERYFADGGDIALMGRSPCETSPSEMSQRGERHSALTALALERESPIIRDHIDLLLALGVPMESHGQSALYGAARELNAELLEHFLAKGADPLFIEASGDCLLAALAQHVAPMQVQRIIERWVYCIHVVLDVLPLNVWSQLLAKAFRYSWKNELDEPFEVTTLYNLALLFEDANGIKLMQLLLQKEDGSHLDQRFDGRRYTNAPLLMHLIGYADQSLLAHFFERFPDYRLPEGPFFFEALKRVVSAENIARLLDRTDDINRLDTIEDRSNSDLKKYHFSYLQSLARYAASADCLSELHKLRLELLLRHGCDINLKGRFERHVPEEPPRQGQTCFLLECVRSQALPLFELALEHGADPYLTTNESQNSQILEMVELCGWGRRLEVIPYLEHLKSKGLFEPNVTNAVNLTPLLVAAAQCQSELCRWLVDAGANIGVSGGPLHQTPLQAAICEIISIPVHQRIETLQTLIRRAGDIHQPNDSGVTPLMLAAFSGSISVIKMLLSLGADPHVEDIKGENAMNYLVHGQCDFEFHKRAALNEPIKAQIIELLSEQGVSLDRCSSDGHLPLSESLGYNYLQLFRTLIRCGADVNGADRLGNTPLMHAIRLERHHFTRELLAHPDIDLARTNLAGENLWHVVASARLWPDLEPVLAALRAADVSLRTDNLGRHPLHLAVMLGRQELITYLLDQGAEVDIRDSDGCSPLMYLMVDACQLATQPRLDIARLLLSRKADINAADYQGVTLLKLSQSSDAQPLTQFLIEQGANPDLGHKRIGF